MRARFLLTFLATSAVAFAQQGIYGPILAHPKAGNRAPDIVFTSLLSAPAPSSWSQSNLTGQLTVIEFFPDTSHNLDSVTRWNSLADQFSDKPVQFLWITGEKESTLLPFLNQHPIKGWVFLDCCGKAGQSYGLQMPETILIGSDRRIIGLTPIPPDQDLLNAALENRITTTRPDKSTLKAFRESHRYFLDAEPDRIPRAKEHKPDFPPSYEVHISPSTGDSSWDWSGDNYRSLGRFSLKEAIQLLYKVSTARTLMPSTLDDDEKRYDIALLLPEPESRDKMNERLKEGIQKYFHFTAQREYRLADVYVITSAPNAQSLLSQQKEIGARGLGIGILVNSEPEAESAHSTAVTFDIIRSIAFRGTTDDLCHNLESTVARPVLNETNLTGEYAINIEIPPDSKDDFLEHLRDQSGLVITPSQRNIEFLVLQPRKHADELSHPPFSPA